MKSDNDCRTPPFPRTDSALASEACDVRVIGRETTRYVSTCAVSCKLSKANRSQLRGRGRT
ncbi:hypothetical protein DF3PB_1350003 [uncultured Defluviicoccus sp.]|uniref:Uncharacterized protein n=1 Tax=metagenome TaxID=256318 RepID=A0A380TAZ8_9ZZZZ|nr:hypothetical protein DF3PB_1350003 [uncultured Defluviicoccus sp.]